ncbi:MAG: aminoglycoside phosphotransferase family protein [Chloroflexota bacterium]
MLNYSQATGLMNTVGAAGDVNLKRIKQGNDVWRIDGAGQTFFLKTFTKEWYGGDAAGTAFNVRHERAAFEILRKYGLTAPEVVLADTTCTNLVGRPFIITRELSGKPLVDLLMLADDDDFELLLYSVGAYLRQMHAITFAHPGYLDTVDGPSAPPDPNGWQHRCWSAAQRQKNALAYLESIRSSLSPELSQRLENHFSTMAEKLASDYQPPHFTHGDCHAHQFFLKPDGGAWIVTGVVDMEVASAGDTGEDWLHLLIELSSQFAPDSHWWKSLFNGYGAPPNFEGLRLRMLAVEPPEFGLDSVNEKLIENLLDAKDWEALFSALYEVA